MITGSDYFKQEVIISNTEGFQSYSIHSEMKMVPPSRIHSSVHRCCGHHVHLRCMIFAIFVYALLSYTLEYSIRNVSKNLTNIHSLIYIIKNISFLDNGKIYHLKSPVMSKHFVNLNSRHTVTVHNVCIRHTQKEYNMLVLNVTHYTSYSKESAALKSIPDLTIQRKSISLAPPGVQFLNQPLFVVNTKAIENIHHNMEDLGVPLYYMMKRTGSLGSHAHMVYTGHPISNKALDYGLNETTITMPAYNLLKLFSAKQQILPASSFEKQMCFKNAVFYRSDVTSKKRMTEKLSSWNSFYRRDMANYIIEKRGIHYDNVTCSMSRLVTIVERPKDRLILNIKKIVNSIRSANIANVTLARMETLTIDQQIQLVHCSDVYVGVHGAALQWAMFLRKGSTLIEIAWPDNNWTFRFTGERYKHDQNIKKIQIKVPQKDLMVDNVSLVKHMYNMADKHDNKHYYGKKRYIEKVVKGKVKTIDMHGNNPYHFASILLDVKVFIKAIRKALSVKSTTTPILTDDSHKSNLVNLTTSIYPVALSNSHNVTSP